MSLLYNDAELIELMQDFYSISGIRIVLFDANGEELIAYPRGEHSFCHCMRKDPEFLSRCRQSDRRAFETCRQTNKLHLSICHAGLIEASVPMISDGRIIGYMMLGRITDKKNKTELVGTVKARCREYVIDNETEEKIKKIRYRNEKQIRAAAKILDACCEYVRLRELVHPSGQRLIDSVERFVQKHISEEISVDRICSEFNISRTKLYETVRPFMNCGIAAFIKNKRLERAKEMLKTTDMTVTGISDACGFSDYNYFLREFKKKYGITAKQIRKNETV